MQDLAHAERSKDGPDQAPDSPAMLGEWGDAWANQAHGSPPMDEPARARGEDVLDPVDVPSVGEGDDEAVSTRERGDRSSVEASADAAPVEDHAEVGKTRSHWPKHGIAHPAIETSQPSGKRHRPIVRLPRMPELAPGAKGDNKGGGHPMGTKRMVGIPDFGSARRLPYHVPARHPRTHRHCPGQPLPRYRLRR